jgi:hypothetical protein
LACPQLVFNRTILMGDASFVIRPHTAASTSKVIATPSRLWENWPESRNYPNRSIIGSSRSWIEASD